MARAWLWVKSLRMPLPHRDSLSVSLSPLSPTGGDVCKGSREPLVETGFGLTAGCSHTTADRSVTRRRGYCWAVPCIPEVQGEQSDGGPSLSLLHPQSPHYLLLSVQSPHYLLCAPKGRPGSAGSLAHTHSSPAGPVNLGHSPQYLSRPSLAPRVTSLLLLSPFLSERQATCLQARMVGPF